MRLLTATVAHAAPWIVLRTALWPDPDDDHAGEVRRLLADPNSLALLAFPDVGDAPLGLAEAALRHDHVNGCDGSPVLFLEGIYVVPSARRRGVARALCDAVATWGRARGVAEFASDAQLDDVASHAFHAALGFAETERVVCFRRLLEVAT